MKVFKKTILAVSLVSSLLMGRVSAQGGGEQHQGLDRVVKLEPVYLACVLNNAKIQLESDLRSLQNFEQVNKKSADAMRMVRKFDFGSVSVCSIGRGGILIGTNYDQVAQKVLKLYPTLETVSCSRDQLKFDFWSIPPGVILALKDKGVKHLDVVWTDIVHDSESLSDLQNILALKKEDFKDMTIDCHGQLICDLKDQRCLDVARKCLEDPNVTLVGCIYVKSSEENSPLLDEIQRHCPNVKIFELDEYFEKLGKNIDEQAKAPLCTLYVKLHN